MTNRKLLDDLRETIITHITNKECVKYCYPEYALINVPDSVGYSLFDGMSKILLHLKDKQLYVHYCTYPNQFGYSIERTIPLSFSKYQEAANLSEADEQLLAIQSQEDIDYLLNEDVDRAAIQAQQLLEEKARAYEEEYRAMAESNRKKFGLTIPSSYESAVPSLQITEFYMDLSQRYGRTEIIYNEEENCWELNNTGDSTYCSRTFTDMELAYIEDQIIKAVNSTDDKKWSSLPGGDMMKVVIRTKERVLEDIDYTLPCEKYVDLLHVVNLLIKYGSRTEEEERSAFSSGN